GAALRRSFGYAQDDRLRRSGSQAKALRITDWVVQHMALITLNMALIPMLAQTGLPSIKA
ncbi:hypothetical protein N9856_04620, partial [Porticoccaceae bacterium]|nr:hypothetical protein [Porticoccaceae bacterium]